VAKAVAGAASAEETRGKIKEFLLMTPARAFRLWLVGSWAGLAFPMCFFYCLFQRSWAKGWPEIPQTTVFAASFGVVTCLGVLALGGLLTLKFTERRKPHLLFWWHILAFSVRTCVVSLLLAPFAFLFARA
jgi:hypothetical protein